MDQRLKTEIIKCAEEAVAAIRTCVNYGYDTSWPIMYTREALRQALRKSLETRKEVRAFREHILDIGRANRLCLKRDDEA